MATEDEGTGRPAVLHTASKVVEVDPDAGTLVLANGTTFSGDLILGADGVSVRILPALTITLRNRILTRPQSVTRKVVAGEHFKPFSSGKAAFRFLVPRQKVLDNPATAHLVAEGYMTLWYGDDRRLVMYPCNDNTMMNFVAIHPSELSASKGEGGSLVAFFTAGLDCQLTSGWCADWSRGASKETLLNVYEAFGPAVKALLEMVDTTSLKVWTLLDMDRIPRWFKGKAVLLGDAAHPFLPRESPYPTVGANATDRLQTRVREGALRSKMPRLYVLCCHVAQRPRIYPRG